MKCPVLRRVLLFVLMAALLCGSVSGCGQKKEPSLKEEPTIAIVEDRPVEWTDEVKHGFEFGMSWRHEAVKTVSLSAAGDPQRLRAIADDVARGNYQLVFSLGTQATEEVFRKLRNKPLIFGAVADPVAAGFFKKDLEHPLGNITGTQALWPYKAQFDMIRTLFPKLKQIGIVFNPNESNSQVSMNHIRAQCGKHNIRCVEMPATTTGEVRVAVNTLLNKKIDLLFIPQDNTAQASSRDIIGLCEKKKVPVFTGVCEIVEQGALAAVGVNYFELGKANAEEAAEILFQGKKAGEVPVATSEKSHFCFNQRVAKNLGVVVPEEIAESAFKIYEHH